jgi:hypothetical protein
MMNEHVLAVFSGKEAVSLLVVPPPNCATVFAVVRGRDAFGFLGRFSAQ